jgi:hypothetical protein
LETKTLLRVAARTVVGFVTIVKESEEVMICGRRRVTAEGRIFTGWKNVSNSYFILYPNCYQKANLKHVKSIHDIV